VEAGATGATAEAQPCPAQPARQDERDNTGTRSTRSRRERFRPEQGILFAIALRVRDKAIGEYSAGRLNALAIALAR